MSALAKQYKLSQDEKIRMSNRINYFRTIPNQVLKSASDLESGVKTILREVVNHEIKSVLVNGRVMVLNVK